MSWRSAGLVAGLVFLLVGVVAVGILAPSSFGGSPSGTPPRATPTPAIATPSSTAPAVRPPRPRHTHHRLRQPLQPVRIHRDPSCPIRPPRG